MHKLIKSFLPFFFLLGLPLWAAPVKILPLGDSITDGAGYNGPHSSYRDELYDLLSNAGYVFQYIGTHYSSYNGINLNHEGKPSIRADQILNGGLGEAPLTTKLSQYTPDIVLLHAGTNDIIQADASSSNDNSHATTKTELEDIITTLQSDNTHVTVLVAKVIPIYQNPDWSLGLNNLLTETWANAVSTSTSKVIIVDQHTNMTAADYADGESGKIGVHPSQKGENKMAQKWFDALKNIDILANQLRSNPELTVTAPPSAYMGSSITLVTSSQSDAAISYTSSSPSICRISHTTITPIKQGTCTILVEQSANSDYLAVSQSISIEIKTPRQEQTISLAVAKQSVLIKTIFNLKATSSSGLTDFDYTSLTPKLCKTNNSLVTALAAGDCKLTVSQAGNDEYKPATSPVKTVHIEKKPQTINLQSPSEAEKGKEFSISANSSASLAVKINSVTPDICSITENTVKPLKTGSCIIKASQAGNSIFKAANKKKTISVTEPKKAGSTSLITLFLLSLFGFISRKATFHIAVKN